MADLFNAITSLDFKSIKADDIVAMIEKALKTLFDYVTGIID